MNRHLLSGALLALFLLSSLPAFCQTKNAAYTDSVIRHYLEEKGAQTTLHSRLRERYIDSALALLPQNAYLWQQRAMPIFKMRQYEAGMPFLDSAVKYDPVRYLPYRAFMKCIFQKSYGSALQDFDAAEKLTGNTGVMDHPYDFYRALCYLQLRDFSNAELFLQKVIEGTKSTKGEKWVHYNDWFYMGIIRYEKEDFAGAARYFDKCLSAFSAYPDAQYYRAVCFWYGRQYDEAARLFIKAEKDANAGYTSNEDNAIYEPYPYAVLQRQIKEAAKLAPALLEAARQADSLSNSGK